MSRSPALYDRKGKGTYMQIFEPVDFDSQMTGTSWRGRLAETIRDGTRYEAISESRTRCVQVGYPSCLMKDQMAWCAKFEIRFAHAGHKPGSLWVRMKPEQLITGLRVEKPTAQEEGEESGEKQAPRRSHWPFFWNRVAESEEGWSELEDLLSKGYSVYLVSHGRSEHRYYTHAGSLICTSAGEECTASMPELKSRLSDINENTEQWGSVFVFRSWKEPGREHILGHDGAVLNWILDTIDELTPLYRLCVPTSSRYPDRPGDLAPPEDGPEEFWDELRHAGYKDGQRPDKYCEAARGIIEACEKMEDEFHGFHCGWQLDKNRFVGFLLNDEIIRLDADGNMKIQLGKLPEQDRAKARQKFDDRFTCQPDDSCLYVMYFGQCDLPEDLYEWLRTSCSAMIEPRSHNP